MKGYGSIAHEAKPNWLLTWSNCFSITQLVGSNNKVEEQVQERFSLGE